MVVKIMETPKMLLRKDLRDQRAGRESRDFQIWKKIRKDRETTIPFSASVPMEIWWGLLLQSKKVKDGNNHPRQGIAQLVVFKLFFEAQNLCSKAILHEYANKYSEFKSLLWLRKSVGDPQESPSGESLPTHSKNGSWKGAIGSQGISKAKFKSTRSYPKEMFPLSYL